MCDTNEIPHAYVEPRTGAKKVTALPVDWCLDEKPKQRYILPGINTRIYYVIMLRNQSCILQVIWFNHCKHLRV